MRTKVFAYKGFIGIQSDFNAEGLLNDPSKPGQLGFVVDADFCDIQPEAIELLKKIPKSGDDIGDVDVFKAGEKVIFAWLGPMLRVLDLNREISGSSSYNPRLLKPANFDTPEQFKQFIDNNV